MLRCGTFFVKNEDKTFSVFPPNNEGTKFEIPPNHLISGRLIVNLHNGTYGKPKLRAGKVFTNE